MPNWGEILKEIQGVIVENPLDIVRRKYLATMYKYTGRNIIAFYSGCIQKQDELSALIDENDKNALMDVVHGLDRKKGLDLILHTPGGNIAATESIVKYLRSMFGNDIRAFIPQFAMSAGTMIALSCKEIIMGKESNIGPIDPQFDKISCIGVIEEFENAIEQIKKDPGTIPLWQTIVSRYHPTFLGDCQKAVEWANKMVNDWLVTNMLKDNQNPEADARNIVDYLSSHELTLNHGKHIHINECINLGIKVTPLESFPKKKIDNCVDLQDCVLAIHHTYMHTFSNTNAVKIIENQNGNAMIINQLRKGV